MSQAETSDLTKIIPEPNTVTVGGKDIPVNTMKVKQLSATIKAIQPFAHAFKAGKGNVDMSEIVMNNTDAVIDLVIIMTGESREFVLELGVDELIQLFTKVVEVNLDFFIQKVLPLLSGAMGRLTAGLPNGGSQTKTSGQNSSNT